MISNEVALGAFIANVLSKAGHLLSDDEEGRGHMLLPEDGKDLGRIRGWSVVKGQSHHAFAGVG
jgi:hypothetical protein